MCEGMSEMLNIDGMTGEGGGQVLRTALGLSVVTQTPFAIDKIRAGRKKPGLQRQHLTGVQAAVRVGCAHVEGAEIGSTSLTFTPSACNGGTYEFAINSAGAAAVLAGATHARRTCRMCRRARDHRCVLEDLESTERSKYRGTSCHHCSAKMLFVVLAPH